MPRYCFFSLKLQMFPMSCHVLKHLGYMMILYFYLVCFTFSISFSVLPFHLVYGLQFLYHFSFLCSFSNLCHKSGKWARRKNLVWWEDRWFIFSPYKFRQTFFWSDRYNNSKQHLLQGKAAIKNRRQRWVNSTPSPSPIWSYKNKPN